MRVSVEEASQLLKSGRVVSIPTETVYGLAASLSHPEAIDEIFRLKGRPSSNPLIIHLAESQQVSFYTRGYPEGFVELAANFWPGPMTIVLSAETEWVPSNVRAGLDTVAFRVPGSFLPLQLLQDVGPLVMPSANLSGRPSATCFSHVEQDFGKEFPVVDGGECDRGVESTILHFFKSRWVVLRLGALSADLFTPFLGYEPEVLEYDPSVAPLSPGQLYKHYAPKAKLILDEGVNPAVLGFIVGFSDREYPEGCRVFSLGKSNQPDVAAKNLFNILRQLDMEAIEAAWVDMRFPMTGLWITVAERLLRASANH